MLYAKSHEQQIIDQLLQYSCHLPEPIDGYIVLAIDGKTIRRSFDRTIGQRAWHAVELTTHDRMQTIGMKMVAGAGKEKMVPVDLITQLTSQS